MRRCLLTALLLLSTSAGAAAQTAVSDTVPVRVAERQIEAFNRKDLDGMMALFAESATMAEFPSGRVIAATKGAIRERFASLLASPTVPVIAVDPRVVQGAFVFELEKWDAKPGERNQAIWMYEIRGGLILRAWTVRM